PALPPYSPGGEPSRHADGRARRIGSVRGASLRVELQRPQLLGDRALRGRNGDRLVRRPDRTQPWALVAARLAPRSRRGQDLRPPAPAPGRPLARASARLTARPRARAPGRSPFALLRWAQG